MIPQKQLDQIKEELMYCKRPIFFFHDDPDGLCSFLLFYRYVGAGKGVIVKTTPRLTKEIFAKKVEDYGADKVFILDVAYADEDFIKAVKVPIVWVDHHEPVKFPGVKYFNPRIQNKSEYSPVAYWCYKVVQKDLWISVVGCIGDVFMPPYFEEFRKQYPDLVEMKTKDIKKIVYDTRLGQLVRIFSFALKGKTKDVMKCVKTLTRIQSPYEILDQKSNQGGFIYKQYDKIYKNYNREFDKAKKAKPDRGVIFFSYKSDMSLTSDMANELSFMHPDKVILLGREKSGEIKFSLRWNKDIRTPLQKALQHVEGYGGGHELACGASIKLKDVPKFVEIIKEEISKH
ncbi:DHH family phosphoesterase [Candidatus Woesearchaeota archaeon]|nr:DHH family phosphoesterase [Candidatus Woesearchaeota archaeon]